MSTSRLLAALDQNPDAIALMSGEDRLSYAGLKAEVEALARRLRGQQAVALMMANSIEWVVADLACISAGVPCVPLPPFFTDAQCEHAMRDAGVSLLLTDKPQRFNGPMERWTVAGRAIAAMGQFYSPVLLPEGTLKITYTSGTTGTPKGVCLSLEAMETVATSLLSVLDNAIAERHVCLLPLAILLENVGGVYTSLLAGATCCLAQVAHSPQALVAVINQTRATSCILVPELLRMLLAADVAMPSLRFAAVGGARVDASLLEAAHARGIPAYEGYGISENASVITLNTPTCFRHGTAGKPLPHIQLKVDATGQIWLRDPLFSGYLGAPPAAGQWYNTGDLGEIDAEGFLHIRGRSRNVYITSFGRNVSPEWPEALLAAHPAIMQAAVFGEARPYSVAVIYTHDAQRVPAAIRQVNAQLPDYARIGMYILAPQPFTPQNGQLTGNGRLRRETIYQLYKPQIDDCYHSQQESYA